MAGRLNRSREDKRHSRRWQILGLLLLGLAVALYWADRQMTGRAGGHLGDVIPFPTPPSEGQQAAAGGTAPAGAAPMEGATEGADAESSESMGPRAEVAAVEAAEPAAETVITAPPAEAEERGDAPEPEEWRDALEGEASDRQPDTAQAQPSAAAVREPDLAPSHATGWVKGDGTRICPEGYPIKGNASSRIYHRPGESSYDVTIAEICFASEEDAATAGYRARKR